MENNVAKEVKRIQFAFDEAAWRESDKLFHKKYRFWFDVVFFIFFVLSAIGLFIGLISKPFELSTLTTLIITLIIIIYYVMYPKTHAMAVDGEVAERKGASYMLSVSDKDYSLGRVCGDGIVEIIFTQKKNGFMFKVLETDSFYGIYTAWSHITVPKSGVSEEDAKAIEELFDFKKTK